MIPRDFVFFSAFVVKIVECPPNFPRVFRHEKERLGRLGHIRERSLRHAAKLSPRT